MAIDTRDKRSSAIGMGQPWNFVGPLPDGTMDDVDRQGVLTYMGIAAEAVTNEFTAADRTMLTEVYKRLGLDSSDPWNVDLVAGEAYTTSRDIVIDITGDGVTTSTETRQ